MSISSIARYLQMAKTTEQRRILIIASGISEPELTETNQVYEVDEMQTFTIFTKSIGNGKPIPKKRKRLSKKT